MNLLFRARLCDLVCLAALAWLAPGLVAAMQPQPDPKRFDADIAAFESEDRATPPPRRSVLFVGSSSIRYWDLARAFPGKRVIKRGFGGSHVSDNIYFAHRILVPGASLKAARELLRKLRDAAKSAAAASLRSLS